MRNRLIDVARRVFCCRRFAAFAVPHRFLRADARSYTLPSLRDSKRCNARSRRWGSTVQGERELDFCWQWRDAQLLSLVAILATTKCRIRFRSNSYSASAIRLTSVSRSSGK